MTMSLALAAAPPRSGEDVTAPGAGPPAVLLRGPVGPGLGLSDHAALVTLTWSRWCA